MYKINSTTYLSIEYIEAIKRMAEELQVSRNYICEQAIKEFLKKHGKLK